MEPTTSVSPSRENCNISLVRSMFLLGLACPQIKIKAFLLLVTLKAFCRKIRLQDAKAIQTDSRYIEIVKLYLVLQAYLHYNSLEIFCARSPKLSIFETV